MTTLFRFWQNPMIRMAVTAAALLVAAVFVDASILLAAPFAIGASLTEGTYAAEFLLTEQNGRLSRSTVTVTVAGSTTLKAGTVLGKVAASGKYVEWDENSSDGRETAVAILYAPLKNDSVSAADMEGVVIDFGAEVIKSKLVWKQGATESIGLANLAARFIKAR